MKYYMESEKIWEIWENPKFHAGGDHKLWIQFAWPNKVKRGFFGTMF